MNKDVYEYLLNFADDKTVISMLSVNRQFRDDKLFERILKRKYPYLASIFFKPDNMNWKEYYIRQVYYMSRLNEKYGIPFVSLPGYIPEYIYKDMDKEKTLNYVMALAAGHGDLDTVKLLIEKGAGGEYGFRSALDYAAQNGHLRIVKFILENEYVFNPYQLGGPLGYVAENGHIEIVRYLIGKGEHYENYVLIRAAKGGHKNIIDLAVQHGATAFSSAIQSAKTFEIVTYLKHFM
jgi:hypothetical protein